MNQDIKKAANPVAHVMSLLISSGALWTAVGVANDLENRIIVNEQNDQTQQQTAKRIEQKVDQQFQMQQEMRDIMIEMKTRMDMKEDP